MLKISPGINFSLASLLSFFVVIGNFVFRCNRWNLRRCCYLLFLVGWLVAFFLEYFVRLKFDSVSHTRIGQRGLSWQRVHYQRRITGETGGKLAEGKFCSSTLATFNFGPFFCVASKDCFVKHVLGLDRFNLFQRSKGMLHFAQRLITYTHKKGWRNDILLLTHTRYHVFSFVTRF